MSQNRNYIWYLCKTILSKKAFAGLVVLPAKAKRQ